MYRLVVRDAVSLPVAVSFVKNDLKKTKLAVIHVDDEYGNGSASLIEESAKKLGMTVVLNEPYASTTKDFSALLTKVKTSGAEAMMVYGDPVTVAAIVKQRYVMGLNGLPMMGANPIGQSSFLSLLSDAEIEGIYGTGTIDPTFVGGEPARPWLERFQAKFNTPADTYAAAYYDGVQLLRNTLAAAASPPDSDAIKKGLATARPYQGITGTFKCSENGECAHSASVFQVRNHIPVVISTVTEPGP
jgi:branched-chain amino acid transport system substrate-binding protein